jgi:diguanylate cyclase (GGDEF)-like protein
VSPSLALSVPAEIIVVIAATLLGFLLLVWVALLRRLKHARSEVAALKSQAADAAQATSAARRMERDLSFVVEFLGEITALMSAFQKLSSTREIPQILLDTMVRLLGAEEAVVLVRGKDTLLDPKRSKQLIVAATTAGIPGLTARSVVPVGTGQLGYAAEVQQVMDEQDYARELGPQSLGPGAHRFAVVAPMVAGKETIGVLAFASPRRNQARGKEALRMIAQLAGMTWYSISTYQTVRTEAETDGLTQVFNKRTLQERLCELVYEAHKNGSRLAVFLFDIDNFKHYNDVNGHLAGDELLRTLARLVRDIVRQDDMFGRFGGEEFLLVMPGKDSAAAMAAADHIRRTIAEFPFAFADRQPLGCLSISGGVAAVPDDANDSAALLRAADLALYKAKDEGRNRVIRAMPSYAGEDETDGSGTPDDHR